MDIKQLRKTTQLTQFELAKRTGIDRTRISLAECGHVGLSESEQAAIAKVISEAAKAQAENIKDALAIGVELRLATA